MREGDSERARDREELPAVVALRPVFDGFYIHGLALRPLPGLWEANSAA